MSVHGNPVYLLLAMGILTRRSISTDSKWYGRNIGVNPNKNSYSVEKW